MIFDLKSVNPAARISVKLVAETGVGTVAAGVSKARADHVTISGHDGGTGASPLTSIKHAGALGDRPGRDPPDPCPEQIAGPHRGSGGRRLRTGRDVVVGALLGADEFGFATAPLIAAGCIMMRKCHLNTCPVGVATQDPELRKRFTGQPEHVINYFFFVAEEVREIMASARRSQVRRSDRPQRSARRPPCGRTLEGQGLDFSKLFYTPKAEPGVATHNCEKQEHGLNDVLDRMLIALAKPALEGRKPVQIEVPVHNVDRTVGAMLSGEVARRYRPSRPAGRHHFGTPDRDRRAELRCLPGQRGDAGTDRRSQRLCRKGLSGGRIVILPPPHSKLIAEDNIIVGNTVLYGAIEGECYFRGVGGERFAVRNSGATAVVEGVGDHGCEYMTGGIVVVIGQTGGTLRPA